MFFVFGAGSIVGWASSIPGSFGGVSVFLDLRDVTFLPVVVVECKNRVASCCFHSIDAAQGYFSVLGLDMCSWLNWEGKGPRFMVERDQFYLRGCSGWQSISR